MDRPLIHLTAPQNWINDPNGLIWDGEYFHLFYQHHPHSMQWGPMHWGHARSKDLLRFEHLPMALAPDELGTMFSGSATTKDGRLAVMYTIHGHDGTETQGVAFSDDWLHFAKHPGNPVIANPGFRDFRDPKLFARDEDGWSMVLAAGDRVMFYRSPDLIKWRKTGEFGGAGFPAEGVWECPDMLRLTDDEGTARWALIVSLGNGAEKGGGRTAAVLGHHEGGTFTPETEFFPMDSGDDFYAATTFSGEPMGKKLMMAWMANPCYAARTPTVGFCGMLSVARELGLARTPDGYRVSSRPFWLAEPSPVALPGDAPLPGGAERAHHFTANAERGFRCTLQNALGEQTVFGIDEDGALFVDRTKSGALPHEFFRQVRRQKLPGGRARLEWVLDRFSLELFAPDCGVTMTNLIFPTEPYDRVTVHGGQTEGSPIG